MAEQQEVVRRRRAALALGQRSPRDDPEQLRRLEWALAAAERYQVVVDRRQVDWLRDREFDRDLVDRVLLTARIADFRTAAGGNGDTPRSTTDVPAPPVTTVAAVLGYLRKHHPPTD